MEMAVIRAQDRPTVDLEDLPENHIRMRVLPILGDHGRDRELLAAGRGRRKQRRANEARESTKADVRQGLASRCLVGHLVQLALPCTIGKPLGISWINRPGLVDRPVFSQPNAESANRQSPPQRPGRLSFHESQVAEA